MHAGFWPAAQRLTSLQFVENTEIGKRQGAGDDKIDPWDVKRLDRRDGHDYGEVWNGGG